MVLRDEAKLRDDIIWDRGRVNDNEEFFINKEEGEISMGDPKVHRMM